jgi:hypothetical protein
MLTRRMPSILASGSFNTGRAILVCPRYGAGNHFRAE